MRPGGSASRRPTSPYSVRCSIDLAGKGRCGLWTRREGACALFHERPRGLHPVPASFGFSTDEPGADGARAGTEAERFSGRRTGGGR